MSSPCRKGGMRLSEALDNMQLAYNPITKQLHFVSPKPAKPADPGTDELDKLSKKSSFSDEGNFSLSTCEKSDTSDSPRSTLQWSGVGHTRGKDGGSFSSTVSSLSECSLGSNERAEDAEAQGEGDPSPDCDENDPSKLKKKGISGFFSRGVFQWKSSKPSDSTPSGGVSWRLFGKPSLKPEPLAEPTEPEPATPHHHRRQGSAASEDLVASSIALIQHDRPSNLPAKLDAEAQRHRAEHQRVVAAARRRVQREAAARASHAAARVRVEDTLSAHAAQWRHILANWDTLNDTKRTQELWWSGLPPPVRGQVWQCAIDNKLDITPETYELCVAQAKEKLHQAHLRRKRLKANRHCDCQKPTVDSKTEDTSEAGVVVQKETGRCRRCICASEESGMELIELDIARTFPHLGMFQPGGPYFSALHHLLAAYVCYRPDVGYVQGMSFLAAVLILNMEPSAAFTCFANLLCGPVLSALYSRDGVATTQLWAAYSRLLTKLAPSLCPPPPELYLLEWGYTAFAKAMPLDAACRVWDLMLRDGDLFLFRAALGVMLLYEEQLQQLDEISAAQFLTRLPEDLDAEALFRRIAAVPMTLDGVTFQQLADQAKPDS